MIRIVGDCNFADGFFDIGCGVGSHIASGKDPFGCLNILPDDFWIGNFECVASTVSNNNDIHSQYFRIEPSILGRFRHLNLYGVANNHVMQHGPDAYKEMLSTIDSLGSAYVGSDKRRSITFTHQGKHVSVVAFNQRPENFSKQPLYWAMPEYYEIATELKSLKESDFKIVYVHWGNEFMMSPYNDQIQFAHFLIDNGADLIIGMHPHVLQGAEEYKGKWIFYSIGNCVFKMAWRPTRYSIRVNVDLSTHIPKITYDYLELDPTTGFPHLAQRVPDPFSIPKLSNLVSLEIENEKYYSNVIANISKYQKANRVHFLNDILKLKPSVAKAIIYDFFQRRRKK